MYTGTLPYQIPDPTTSQFNFAAINNFYCVALDIPGAAFYTQTVSLPSATMEDTPSYNTPFNNIPLAGTGMKYGELQLSFIVNEDFSNYKALYEWMTGITFPQNNQQFIDQVNKKTGLFPGGKNVEMMLRSDLHVVALNSRNEPITVIKFLDAFPTSIGSLPWDATQSDVTNFTAAISFSYTNYVFE